MRLLWKARNLTMSEQTPQQQEKKDIPSVGRKRNNALAGFVLISLFVIIFAYGVFSSGDEKEDKRPVDDQYSTTGYSNERILQRQQEAKRTKKPSKKASDERPQLTREEMIALLKARQAEADAAQAKLDAAEAEKLEQAKRASGITVFQSSGGRKAVQSANNVQATNFGAIAGLNQDNEPAEKPGTLQLGNTKKVDVSQAVQINNMYKTVAAGKFIQGILETAIDSTLPGQVRAVVSSDLYSENGANVLIPKGSRLVGQYQSGIRQGQNRVFVIWSHVTTPTGVQVSLESAGTDALGTAGMGGDYDSHFFKRFGAALLLSIIENYESDQNDLNVNTGNSLNRASSIALEKDINIPPTIYVDQGEKINVFIARNLNFEGV